MAKVCIPDHTYCESIRKYPVPVVLACTQDHTYLQSTAETTDHHIQENCTAQSVEHKSDDHTEVPLESNDTLGMESCIVDPTGPNLCFPITYLHQMDEIVPEVSVTNNAFQVEMPEREPVDNNNAVRYNILGTNTSDINKHIDNVLYCDESLPDVMGSNMAAHPLSNVEHQMDNKSDVSGINTQENSTDIHNISEQEFDYDEPVNTSSDTIAYDEETTKAEPTTESTLQDLFLV